MAGAEGSSGEAEEFLAVNAIRDAIPTRRHAEMLFDMVLDLLGEEAWVETANGETCRTLYRRESPGSAWILPWPLLSVSRGGREGPSPVLTAIPGVYEEPRPRPGPAPRLRDLGPGALSVRDGSHEVMVCYGADGRWFECSLSGPDAFAGAVPALAEKSAPPVELLAAHLAKLDAARHGPGRVHLPVALPGGARGVWDCGLHALREALFRERVPRAARWAAADGWTGGAVAWGATRDAAMDSWRREVARVRPFPARPKPPAEPLPESTMEQGAGEDSFFMKATLRGPSSDVAWVEPTTENSPAALVPLGDLPGKPPALGEWMWLLGARGTAVPAALRLEKEGFTLVGDRALEGLDLAGFEEGLAAAESAAPPWPPPPPDLPADYPVLDSCLRIYRLADGKTGKPVRPKYEEGSLHKGFRADNLDGDRYRWHALRLRRGGR